MTPESRNSPLLDNGWLTHVCMELRIRGDQLGKERAFHVNGINKGSHGYMETNIFHVYALDYKSGNAEKIDSVVREFNDPVTNDSSSVISHSGREDARGPVRNGASLRQSLIVSCYD
jgi:hypothetical protein